MSFLGGGRLSEIAFELFACSTPDRYVRHARHAAAQFLKSHSSAPTSAQLSERLLTLNSELSGLNERTFGEIQLAVALALSEHIHGPDVLAAVRTVSKNSDRALDWPRYLAIEILKDIEGPLAAP